jgi:hypothetical protein
VLAPTPVDRARLTRLLAVPTCRLQKVVELPPLSRGCHVITRQLLQQVRAARSSLALPGACVAIEEANTLPVVSLPHHSQLPELAEFEVGMANFFVQHTSCSLTINENASPGLQRAGGRGERRGAWGWDMKWGLVESRVWGGGKGGLPRRPRLSHLATSLAAATAANAHCLLNIDRCASCSSPLARLSLQMCRWTLLTAWTGWRQRATKCGTGMMMKGRTTCQVGTP